MSGIFDLDTEGAAALDERARLNPLDVSQIPPGLWEGSGEAAKSLLRASAGAGRTIMMAGAPFAMLVDEVSDFGSDVRELSRMARNPLYRPDFDQESTAYSDRYFRAVDDFGSDAVDYWTADPAVMGSAAKALNIGANVVGSIPQMIGMPALFLSTAGVDPAVELTRQGVDAGTAMGVGAVNLAVNAIGMRIPAAFGNTLTARVASGAGANLALGVAADTTSSAILQAGGYAEPAEGFDAADPFARGLDALMGAAFGWRAHIEAPRVMTPVQRDAVLAINNNDHLHRRTLPGEPTSPKAARGHGDAMAAALRQALAGEPVNVADAIRVEDFILKPEQREPSSNTGQFDQQGYTAFRRALESGGRPDAKNPRSSALGADQFTAKTWRAIVAKAQPAWAEGLDDAQLLAARRDPEKSAQMAQALDAENAAALEAAGQEVSRHTLYAAHHFGAGKGVAFAQAADDAPMSQILTAAQIKANPYLAGLTKAETIANWDARARRAGVNRDGSLVDTNEAGQALRRRFVEDEDALFAEYAARPDSRGGVVLNTDIARELSPEYLADRTRSVDVHEAASDVVKALYAHKLAEPTPEGMDPVVLFTAGGTGAGKTTGERAMGDAIGRPEIVYDTNMNTLSSAVTKIEQALAAGRGVEILYIYRDPVESLAQGAIPRAKREKEEFGTGRTVPLEEHARTHVGVRPTIEALAEKYAEDARVNITAVDNSRGKGNQRIVDLASLPRVEEDSVRERLRTALEEARTAGLDDDLYRGFGSAGRSARPALAGNRGEDQGQASGAIPEDRGEVAAFLDELGNRRTTGDSPAGFIAGIRVQDNGDHFRVMDMRDVAALPDDALFVSPDGETLDRGGVEELLASALSLRDAANQQRAAEVHTPLQAAQAIGVETPDTQVLDGFDADGNPRYRSLSDALADIEAEHQRATTDAEAFPAAVNCAMRRGFNAS